MTLRRTAQALAVSIASVAVVAMGSAAHADTAWEHTPTSTPGLHDTAWE